MPRRKGLQVAAEPIFLPNSSIVGLTDVLVSIQGIDAPTVEVTWFKPFVDVFLVCFDGTKRNETKFLFFDGMIRSYYK